MFLINKNDKLVINKISIKYNKYHNIYNLFYKLNYIKCNSISININITNFIKYNNLYYLEINDFETLKLLYKIETHLKKYILFFSIILYKNNKKYIICNNIYNKDIVNMSNLNISIKKIINKKYSYVPIIYIL